MRRVLKKTEWTTFEWVKKVVSLGAGEIVLNCINQDGVRQGYDIEQLKQARAVCNVPLIASGGAGTMQHFSEVYQAADVDGALAASVFHKAVIEISDLKNYLKNQNIEVRPCL
jgi:cyclase